MASAFGKAASLVMGTSAFAGSLYMSYNIKRMELQFQERHKQQQQQQQQQQQHLPADYSFVATPERNKQYEQVAKCYDKSIGREELVSGIIWMRRCLLKYHAKGNCLEVGAGTARNLEYYPNDKVT